MAIDSNKVLGELGTLFLEGVTKSNKTICLPFKSDRFSEHRAKAPLAIIDEIRLPFMQLISRPF